MGPLPKLKDRSKRRRDCRSWVVQSVTGKECDVRPALSEVGGKTNHRRPVVIKSSIAGAKHSLVVDPVSHTDSRLKIVVGIVNEFCRWATQ